MNCFDNLNAFFCPGYPRAKMARLFHMEVFTFKERKYRFRSKSKGFGQISRRQRRRCSYFLFRLLSSNCFYGK